MNMYDTYEIEIIKGGNNPMGVIHYSAGKDTPALNEYVNESIEFIKKATKVFNLINGIIPMSFEYENSHTQQTLLWAQLFDDRMSSRRYAVNINDSFDIVQFLSLLKSFIRIINNHTISQLLYDGSTSDFVSYRRLDDSKISNLTNKIHSLNEKINDNEERAINKNVEKLASIYFHRYIDRGIEGSPPLQMMVGDSMTGRMHPYNILSPSRREKTYYQWSQEANGYPQYTLLPLSYANYKCVLNQGETIAEARANIEAAYRHFMSELDAMEKAEQNQHPLKKYIVHHPKNNFDPKLSPTMRPDLLLKKLRKIFIENTPSRAVDELIVLIQEGILKHPQKDGVYYAERFFMELSALMRLPLKTDTYSRIMNRKMTSLL